jgi:hypothetical protein
VQASENRWAIYFSNYPRKGAAIVSRKHVERTVQDSASGLEQQGRKKNTRCPQVAAHRVAGLKSACIFTAADQSDQAHRANNRPHKCRRLGHEQEALVGFGADACRERNKARIEPGRIWSPTAHQVSVRATATSNIKDSKSPSGRDEAEGVGVSGEVIGGSDIAADVDQWPYRAGVSVAT